MDDPLTEHGDVPLEEVRHALRERVKELTCLYDVSAILAAPKLDVAERMQAVVDRMPRGWQFPEIAAARLCIGPREYHSAGWADSPARLQADLLDGGEVVGRLELAYVDAPASARPAPAGSPGPQPLDPKNAFLEEESLLIAELALRVGTFLERERSLERARSLERERGLDRARGLEDRRPGTDRAPVRTPGAISPASATEPGSSDHGLIGTSSALQAVHAAIDRAAATDATILILGESGTGKELVARAIHYCSARSTSPFVPVNCAAIPEGLVESELFGYVKGAFSGATQTRAGFFQTAQGGTIFLDEVGETSLNVQAKLLRVLENDEIRMVGSDRIQRADTRIVAATHKDLPALVKAGRFRADLYFRLHVLSVELPPLRERVDDLALLLEHFQHKWGARTGGHAFRFTPRALAALRAYDWPGNVRELENLVHRLAVMTEGDTVDLADLPGPMRAAPGPTVADARSLAEVERQHVRHVLDSVDGNRSLAARILGIDRKTLRKKLEL